MKSNSDQILDTLNKLLCNELSAIDQYFTHGEMYADWGLTQLHEKLMHELDEEREHAKKLIARLLFLEGTPNLQLRPPLNIGSTVPEMLTNDLAFELHVIKDLREAIALCESKQDYQTRALLTELLRDSEEGHAYWIEQQLELIDRVGLQNYQQAMMKA